MVGLNDSAAAIEEEFAFWTEAALLCRRAPVLCTDVSRSSFINSSPYLLGLGRFIDEFGTNERRKDLCVSLKEMISEITSAGIQINLVLVGGSIIDRGVELPKDIDCVLLYAAVDDDDVRRLGSILSQFKRSGIDARSFPTDVSPLILVKAVAYFTALYARNRFTDESAGGCYVLRP